jgi:cysteine desulfurase
VAGIAGFGAAARAALVDRNDNAAWRDAAAARLKAEGAVIVAEEAPRLPNTLCVASPGYGAEVHVMSLDLAGVMVSAGSACSSGKVKASHVLTAMGLGDLAACAIRVSGGWASTEADWRAFVEAWLVIHNRHRARAAASAA